MQLTKLVIGLSKSVMGAAIKNTGHPGRRFLTASPLYLLSKNSLSCQATQASHFERSTRQWRAFETKITTFGGTTRKFVTKSYRRAREPSRISLRFLRRLENKSSMLKKFVFKRIRRFLYRSLQSCIAKLTLMLKRLESFIAHVINVIINTIQRYFIQLK